MQNVFAKKCFILRATQLSGLRVKNAIAWFTSNIFVFLVNGRQSGWYWTDSCSLAWIFWWELCHNAEFNKDERIFLVFIFGHLVIEKLLKALYVKKLQTHPVFSHDLLRLAKKIKIDLPEDYSEWLDAITTFNLNARYDNYKQSFNKLCTKEFTAEWINKIEILRKWLIHQL